MSKLDDVAHILSLLLTSRLIRLVVKRRIHAAIKRFFDKFGRQSSEKAKADEDARFGEKWYWKPALTGLKEILKDVKRLKEENWYKTETHEKSRAATYNPKLIKGRSADGAYNNDKHPNMGAANTRFARNFPLDKLKQPVPESVVGDPNPRDISLKLMTRGDEIQPVPHLNVLAAAWIQFQVHDWFNHELDEKSEPWKITILDDKNRSTEMKVLATEKSPVSKNPNNLPKYNNTQVHWWDGSQIYGSDEETVRRLRTGKDGKLKITSSGLLPLSRMPGKQGFDETGFTNNWWLGLRILHTLFTLEHNTICTELIEKEELTDDEEIFRIARLINSAQMAKIHSVEWTPVFLGNPILQLAMKADWTGITPKQFERLADNLEHIKETDMEDPKLRASFIEFMERREFEWIRDWLGKSGREIAEIYEKEGIAKFIRLLLSGQPKRVYKTNTQTIKPNQHAMTEEFVSVYRMHPLLPDEYNLRYFENDAPIPTPDKKTELWNFKDLSFDKARDIDAQARLSDVFYSFGTDRPGALVLNNFPKALQNIELPKIQHPFPIDLAAVDILRDRERGVPRYNEFRKLLYKEGENAKVTSFEELTGGDKALADKICEAYCGEIDKVDLMVGLYAEPVPPGFAFCETTFLIFALMAPLRLQSDRFLTKNYNERFYTKTGLQWVESSNMTAVIGRHYPELNPLLKYVDNAFTPWPRRSIR